MNKKILFVLLFLFFSILACNTSFGYDENTELRCLSKEGVFKTFPRFDDLVIDELPLHIITYDSISSSSSKYRLIFTNYYTVYNHTYPTADSDHTIPVHSYVAYILDGSKWVFEKSYTVPSASTIGLFCSDVFYTNFDLPNGYPSYSGVYFANCTGKNERIYPTIETSNDELSNGNFNYLTVNAQDFSNYSFYLLVYNHSSSDDDQSLDNLYPTKQITLETSCPYYSELDGYGHNIYKIPFADLELPYNKDDKYSLGLAFLNSDYDSESEGFYRFEYISFTVGNSPIVDDEESKRQEELETQRETTNAIKEQTEVIKEQNETSKGIWGTLKELLSYINPLSENFFVYKLVELLINAFTDLLKFLFIPDDDFFSNWFSDMNDTFKDQFGILYYPVSVAIEFLNTFDSALHSGEPIINTPEFKLSFMNFNATLLPAFHYNFNDLLQNESFEKLHTFYIFFVNVIFTIGLIAFASKVSTEIFGGIDDSVDSAVYNSQAQARANNSYARQQQAKLNYKRGNGR